MAFTLNMKRSTNLLKEKRSFRNRLFKTAFFSALFSLFLSSSFADLNMSSLKEYQNLVPVAVVGSGPAGLGAAMVCGENLIYTVVFEGKEPGGPLNAKTPVGNWPGIISRFVPIGYNIMGDFKKQASSWSSVKFSKRSIEKVDCTRWPYKLELDDQSEVYALSIVVATGSEPKRLHVPKEDLFWNQGVLTYLEEHRRNSLSGKHVLVVGGSDDAMRKALRTAFSGAKVTLIVRGDKLKAAAWRQERVKKTDTIDILYGSQIKEFLGENGLSGALVQTPHGMQQIKADLVYLAIGRKPQSQLFTPWVKTLNDGNIELEGRSQKSSRPGILAAGDVADPTYRQGAIAASGGMKAGYDATSFLEEKGYDANALKEFETQFFNPK